MRRTALSSLCSLTAALALAPAKGFVVHPVEYNLGLWKTWLDK
jgi:hypothetical protein